MRNLKLNHPEEEILSVSRTTETLAQEHVTDLTTFGINAEYLTGFKNKIHETEDLFDETKERIDLKVLTEGKNKVLADCYEWCRHVCLRIETAMGRDSVAYKTFPSKALLIAKYSETEMLPLIETIHKIAETHADALAAAGQTPEILAEGITLKEQLNEADSLQEIQKVYKKGATQTRYKKFNELVGIVNMINKIGRNLYREVPENYVKFESPWKRRNTSDVEILKGDIDPEATILIKEELDADAQILLENKGLTKLLFFAGNKEDGNPGITLSPGDETILKLTDLGEGSSLFVENLSSNSKGSYRVRI